MPHDAHCGCGCGHDHSHPRPTDDPASPIEATGNQKDFLHQLGHHRCLPVARFSVQNSREPDFIATALAPVFIRTAADDRTAVKEAGDFLQALEDMGLITLDYDIPIKGYDSADYKGSALYA